MIGRALDSLVSLISPSAGLHRTRARMAMGMLRGYDGARIDRTTSGWKAQNRAADLELLNDADRIRALARDLVRNNAYAKGIVNAIRRNVVGCGIMPQARTGSEARNKAYETLFDRWQRQADVTGRLSFYEIQALVITEMVEAGECLIRFVSDKSRGRVLPLALELIEADRFYNETSYRGKNANPDNGNEIRRGVEIDRHGVPVAYWIYERNPDDLNSLRTVATRIPADECVHLFRQDRIGQTRGISMFAPVTIWLQNLREYMTNEAIAKRLAACFGVAIESLSGPADGGILPADAGSGSDTNGNTFDHLEPGIVARLFPGEKVSVIGTGRGEDGAKTYINLMLHAMAVGVGISYERLTRDYSQTNYSSNRAADLEDRREFRPLQDLIIRQLCEATWKRFLASAVDEGGFTSFPSTEQFVAKYADLTAHVWQAPGWEWVDPVKEVTASTLAVANGFSTLEDECGARGRDWRDVADQKKREQDYYEKIGLKVTAENIVPLAAAVIAAEQNQNNAQNQAGQPAAA